MVVFYSVALRLHFWFRGLV